MRAPGEHEAWTTVEDEERVAEERERMFFVGADEVDALLWSDSDEEV